MSLLYTQSIQDELISQLKNATDSIQIITAYCKLSAINLIEQNISNMKINKRILIRFRLDDIMSGSTDLELYDFCKANSWKMYVRFDLHAKTYIFDNKKGIVGSANATSNGLGLNSSCNYELGSLIPIDIDDIVKVNSLFDSALLINDDIFLKMQAQINKIKSSNTTGHKWNDGILSLCYPKINALFTYDLPLTYSVFDKCNEKYDFMESLNVNTIEDVKKAFTASKCYRWLKEFLLSQNNYEAYYGAVSQALHSIIINDPKPYRKEIKTLQSNLFNWIKELDIVEISIDRPNYSERIRLIT